MVEAVPREDEFYDFEACYEIGRTDFVLPAELPGRRWRAAQELALRTYALLGCSAPARVDLMVDAEGELTVLETNVIPGPTETSLLPQAAEAAGIGFDELVGRILDPRSGRCPLLILGEAWWSATARSRKSRTSRRPPRCPRPRARTDRGPGDHVLRGEDRGTRAHGQREQGPTAASRSGSHGRSGRGSPSA